MLVIDTKKLIVERVSKISGIQELKLARLEYYLLLLFANNEWNNLNELMIFLGKTYYKDICKNFRIPYNSKNYLITSNTFRTYISRLRKKGVYIEANYTLQRYRVGEQIWIK